MILCGRLALYCVSDSSATGCHPRASIRVRAKVRLLYVLATGLFLCQVKVDVVMDQQRAGMDGSRYVRLDGDGDG